jgi:hypothetical protein
MAVPPGKAGSASSPRPPHCPIRMPDGSPRYYLDLFGAARMVPYAGDNSVERLVARVTLAFFARYVLGDTSALSR